MQYPRLKHYDERKELDATDSLVICFYFQQPHLTIASAVVRALDILREKILPYRFTRYVGEGQTEPLDDAAWSRLRAETLGPEDTAFLVLEDDSETVEGLYVDYRGLPWPLPAEYRRPNDVSVLHVRLPTEYLEERGPAHLHALALEMARDLPFNSGYVDFALCETRSCDAIELIRSRYPGVHHAFSSATLSMNTWVEGVHWMNFLGQPVLGQLGGVSGLRERLAFPEPCIQEMGADRVLVTLGEHPETGDVEAGQTLPRHRALARLLEPHLFHRQKFLGRLRPEELLRWERRFLDDPA